MEIMKTDVPDYDDWTASLKMKLNGEHPCLECHLGAAQL